MRLAESATFAMMQKSNELSAQGVNVINMSVGEPDFNTPDHVKRAAIEAVEQNYSKYSPVRVIFGCESHAAISSNAKTILTTSLRR